MTLTDEQLLEAQQLDIFRRVHSRFITNSQLKLLLEQLLIDPQKNRAEKSSSHPLAIND